MSPTECSPLWSMCTCIYVAYRCQLLLQAYKTTIEEDSALLSGAKPLSPCSAVAVQMRLCEKKILYNAALFARTLREHLLTQPAETQNGSESERSQPSMLVGATNRAPSPPVIVEVDNCDHEPSEAAVSDEKGITSNGDCSQLGQSGEGRDINKEDDEGVDLTGEVLVPTKGEEEKEREDGTMVESQEGGGDDEAINTELKQTKCVNGNE